MVCGTCKADLPEAAFAFRNGRTNKTCVECRKEINARESPRKMAERRGNKMAYRAKRMEGGSGKSARCEVCGELVSFVVECGQLVAVNLCDREHHPHQPLPTSPAENRARVANGVSTAGYLK